MRRARYRRQMLFARNRPKLRPPVTNIRPGLGECGPTCTHGRPEDLARGPHVGADRTARHLLDRFSESLFRRHWSPRWRTHLRMRATVGESARRGGDATVGAARCRSTAAAADCACARRAATASAWSGNQPGERALPISDSKNLPGLTILPVSIAPTHSSSTRCHWVCGTPANWCAYAARSCNGMRCGHASKGDHGGPSPCWHSASCPAGPSPTDSASRRRCSEGRCPCSASAIGIDASAEGRG